jgi:hypothetical protein
VSAELLHLREIRHLPLGHEQVDDRRVHPVDAQDDDPTWCGGDRAR